jgi:hypothetical protein
MIIRIVFIQREKGKIWNFRVKSKYSGDSSLRLFRTINKPDTGNYEEKGWRFLAPL